MTVTEKESLAKAAMDHGRTYDEVDIDAHPDYSALAEIPMQPTYIILLSCDTLHATELGAT